MQSDNRRHFSRNTITEVATYRVTYHLTQFCNGVALRSDGMSKRGGDVTAINFIFLNFKNDFAHKTILLNSTISRKLATGVLTV